MHIIQKDFIKTKRLTLQSYRECDKEQLVKILTDEKVTKTFMVPDFSSIEQVFTLAEKLISFSKIDDFKHLEYGIYLDDLLIGFINDCGYEDQEIEIGYVIYPQYEGQGFATEATRAVIQDLFDMGFEKITAGYFEENFASRKVMMKCDMHENSDVEEVEYRGVVHTCRYFEIEKKDYWGKLTDVSVLSVR